MKLIKPSYSIIEPTGYTIDDIYKSIELAGKVSHKSEHNIKEGSAKEFVDRMIKLGHGATLEFGTVYLFIPLHCDKTDYHIAKWYYSNPYSRVKIKNEHYCFDSNGYYITTNFRVLVENNLIEHLKFICEPTEHHEKRICVKFICDRAIANEIVRHRKFSFLQESTRYCNYSKDKFGNELTFIIPCWMDIPEGSIELGNYDKTATRYKDGNLHIIDNKPPYAGMDFIRSLCESESDYLSLIRHGWRPEQARVVLPLALKTELYMCGFLSDWENFWKLRDDKQHAHPQAYELAHPLHEEFIKKGYI